MKTLMLLQQALKFCGDKSVRNTKQERKSHLNASSVNRECLNQPNRQKQQNQETLSSSSF